MLPEVLRGDAEAERVIWVGGDPVVEEYDGAVGANWSRRDGWWAQKASIAVGRLPLGGEKAVRQGFAQARFERFGQSSEMRYQASPRGGPRPISHRLDLSYRQHAGKALSAILLWTSKDVDTEPRRVETKPVALDAARLAGAKPATDIMLSQCCWMCSIGLALEALAGRLVDAGLDSRLVKRGVARRCQGRVGGDRISPARGDLPDESELPGRQRS